MTYDCDKEYLGEAVAESRKCVPTDSAYSVGAVIITAEGEKFTGHSRETSPVNHAEEEAILKASNSRAELRGATMYSSMEPCSKRKSKPESCSELIVRHGFSRVVFGFREPPVFVECCGQELLNIAGIETLYLEGYEKEVLEINQHILLN